MGRGIERTGQLEEVQSTRGSKHEYAMLAILCGTGLRIGEVVSLKDIDLAETFIPRRAR